MPPKTGDLLEMLLKLGYVRPDDLRGLKERAAAQGISPLEAALLGGRLHPDARGWILAEGLGIPFLELEADSVPLALSDVLSEAIARENLIVPVSREGDRLTVAAVDPFRHKALAAIEEMTGLSLRMVISPVRTIREVLDRLYPGPKVLDPAFIAEGAIGRDEAEEWLSLGGGRRVVEEVLLYGATHGMNGIRMYPVGQEVAIEGRGPTKNVLLLSCPLRFRRLLYDAFRELAGVPAEARGVANVVFPLESAVGVTACRASFVEGLSGPEVIVRILPDQRAGIPLDSLGWNSAQLDITQKVLGKRQGLFLVSSPGPEGVATTLFAMLRETWRPGNRVVTVEERHRFRNEGYIQLERRQAEGLYAHNWPRLAETLEPDILMVEYVPEPADLADLLHLAEGGTVVLCGIRRFNFDRSLRTLLSLDVDPFILAHVTRLVVHQRLVKLLCMECRRPIPAKPSLRMVGERYRDALEQIVRDESFYLPSGCLKCHGTGYSGKMALIEALPFTPGVQNIVASDAWLEEKLAKLLDEDFYSAVDSVHDLLRRGMVTYDDVFPFFR